MAKKVQYTTNQPSSTTDYLSADNTWKPISSGGGGVPYTGATANVDLGTHTLTTVGTNYTPITPPAYGEGKVWYDSVQKSLAFYNDASYAPVYIGENIVLKVYNNTGSTISKGAPVYIQSGGIYTYPNVALAKADSASTAAVIGLMNGDTPTGSIGYVTSAGVITGVNTGGITEGTILYLSPYSAGQLMSTVPPTGYAIQVGVVAHQNTPNGTIYTKQTTPLAVSAATIVGGLTVAQGGTGVTSITASRALTSDATSKVVASSVTSTELGYVSGVTSSIQTQLNSKQDAITGAATTITSSNLTNYRALVSDGGGKVAVAATTSNEIGYLSGVTSNIQTQLDGKTSVARSFMAVNQNATLVLSSTSYGSFIFSGLNVAESARVFVVPYACTMKNFYVRMFSLQPATGSLVFTLRKNSADTSVVVTIAAGSAANTEANSGATSATFAAGDDCTIKVVNNATGTSGTINNTSIMIEI